MVLYAHVGSRRAAQLVGDLLLVVWVLAWAYFGAAVHDAVVVLGRFGREVEQGGSSLAGNLGEAGERAAAVPLVGDELRSPFDRAAAAARAVAEAGRTQQELVAQLGLLLGWGTAMVPILFVVVLWVPRRVAFVRRATAARRHLDSTADLHLFALRAMAGQPMHRIAGITDDPVGAWRRADPDVVRRLAALELRDMGLRVPTRLDAAVPRS